MTNGGDLQACVRTVIADGRLFSPGASLIVGLSGGADSVALLHLLATLPGFPLQLTAAHLNHALRGAESDDDERFCRDLADRLAIPFEARRVDVAAMAAAAGLNLEDAGRRARCAFFDELAASRGAAGVVLGHHADDQAETVLMRLLRGSGARGLAGMASRNRRGCIRPLLGVTRREIEAYLNERGLSWREDASNRDTAFQRNRVRHELLPHLESYNPAVRQALSSTADILAAEDDLLEHLALQAAERLCRFAADEVCCDIARLQAEPVALQRRIIRLAIGRLAGSLDRFSHRHVEQILQLPSSGRPNLRLDLPGGLAALREYGTLAFRRSAPPRPATTAEAAIPGPGEYLLPDGSRLVVSAAAPGDGHGNAPSCICFDVDRAPFPWQVRTFRPGDRIRQAGMAGSKKVKDLFIDEKIPLSRRAVTPLIFSGGELIWVVGLRTSRAALPDSRSGRVAACRISS